MSVPEWEYPPLPKIEGVWSRLPRDPMSPRIVMDKEHGLRVRGWYLTDYDRKFLRSCNVRAE